MANIVATPEGEPPMLNAFTTTRRKAAAAVTTAALLAGGGAAAIAANSATASAASSTPATHVAKAAHKAKAHKGLLARTDHAVLEIKMHGKWVTLVLDRGAVSSVSSSAITLHLPDGKTATEAINTTTKFNKDKTWSAIKVGHNATVVSDNGVARRVLQGKKALAHTPKSVRSAASA
jgi:hypothetical protein